MTGLTTPPFQKRDSNSRLLAEKQKLAYNFLGEIFFYSNTCICAQYSSKCFININSFNLIVTPRGEVTYQRSWNYSNHYAAIDFSYRSLRICNPNARLSVASRWADNVQREKRFVCSTSQEQRNGDRVSKLLFSPYLISSTVLSPPWGGHLSTFGS